MNTVFDLDLLAIILYKKNYRTYRNRLTQKSEKPILQIFGKTSQKSEKPILQIFGNHVYDI